MGRSGVSKGGIGGGPSGSRLAALALASLVVAGAADGADAASPAPMRKPAAKPSTKLVNASTLATEDLSGPLSPLNLAESLVGLGVTISNVTYTGADIAAGVFSSGAGILSFPSGVVLSSGNVASVAGPNQVDSVSTDNGLGGDPDLDQLTSGTPTLDATVLEFDFVPDASEVFFEYVFGSDEYNEYVDSVFNDVFAFYVNGQNCAVVGSQADPVSVNTINNGNPYGGGGPNSNLYLNNDLDDGGGSINTEMDGVTQTLVCHASVVAGAPNHIKLAIADSSDHIFDSNVFIRGGSFSTTPPESCNDGVDNDGDGSTDCSDFECASSPYCVSPTCGNGTLDSGEQCDDGNTSNGDGCRADCTLESCGDGVLDPGEQCDDGDDPTEDSCRSDCTLQLCGDGIVDVPEEQCDDGNLTDGDGCDSECVIETVHELVCDDGEDDDDDLLIDCADPDCAGTPACTLPGQEVCDNGQDDDGDLLEDCDDPDCGGVPACACTDLDGDGYGNPEGAGCAKPGLDCDDADDKVNPGRNERPGNGLDDDCNGATLDCQDLDGDGYGSPIAADCPLAGLDCNDGSAVINPGRTEIPSNGQDDDCNPATPGGCSPQLAAAGTGDGRPARGAVDLGLYLIPAYAAAMLVSRMRARATRS